ncbi:MAG: DUF1192 domain-containing protein [Salaquimonas sp.]|jgi:uncharacterized small protein (DUF1192 family)|nr:DUF1192 domain-containing protein [Salaquimonas sp.]
MFEDDAEPVKTPGYMIGQVLDTMSVEELEHTIQRLKEEIARLEQARDQKSGHLAAAESLFSKK